MEVYNTVKGDLVTRPKVWLITGSAGFIGSNLVEALLNLEQRVIGLDNFSTGSHRNLTQVRKAVSETRWHNFRQIEGDVRIPSTCELATQGVDCILHHAALASVAHSIEAPDETHATNVTGFINLLTAARRSGVRRFVYASSSAVYGDDSMFPKREESIGRCLSPYAATKRVNEIYADVFARCYGLDAIGLRYFNIFGPKQDPNGAYAAVIPKWINAMMKGEVVGINGDGQTSRDFCFVSDVVQANILAAVVSESSCVNQIYNIASGNQTTLLELYRVSRAKLVCWYPSLNQTQPIFNSFRQGDIRYSSADISKAIRLLGYKPLYNIEQGLIEALDWYRNNVATLKGQSKLL